MKLSIAPTPAALPRCIYYRVGKTNKHGYRGWVKRGTRPNQIEEENFFGPQASFESMARWAKEAGERLDAKRAANPTAKAGTLLGAVEPYKKKLAEAALLTPTAPDKIERAAQRLQFFCAQSIALHSPVLSVKDVQAKRVGSGLTFGDVARTDFQKHLERLEQVLTNAFRPTNARANRFEHARTSNIYRSTLVHLFNTLDRHTVDAEGRLLVNPVSRIKPRDEQKGATRVGLDMRLIREILIAAPSVEGRPGDNLSELRAAVLASTLGLTPQQLVDLGDPRKAFHDEPGATREDILAGAITLLKPARQKGRGVVPPELLPLTPWAVAEWRAYCAEPKCWAFRTPENGFSRPSLNRYLQQGAERVEAKYAKRKIELDLGEFTLYLLKHSLAAAAEQATGGLWNAEADALRQSAEVQKALQHGSGRTTKIYTRAAAHPLLVKVNRDLTVFLDALYARPLVAADLRVVNA